MTGTKRAASPAARLSPPPVKRKLQSTSATNQAAVSAFFTPASKKKPEKITWRTLNNSLLVGRYSSDERKPSDASTGLKRRVAAFDLDSTLISTASNSRFARNAEDWKWWHAKVPGRVKELSSEGYQVIIVSNQKKVALQSNLKGGKSDSKSLSTFKEKATAVMKQLDIPLSIYAATQYDEFRKPRLGMWKEILDEYDVDVDERLDREGSFFVGDAAGRAGDHSCSDRDFAANIGITFKTPEEFFLNEPPLPFTRDFDPSTYLNDTPKSDAAAALPLFSKRNPHDLVIFCGSPGSGKSTFYWKYLQPLGYERVNQDILKSRPKCLKVAREHLANGRSVAVDNTNASPPTRALWTALAAEFNIPTRCIYFTAPPQLCRHNDAVRASNPKDGVLNPEARKLLPGIAFGDFAKRFEEPDVGEEGFQDVVRVDFRFFDDGDGGGGGANGDGANGEDGEGKDGKDVAEWEERKRVWSQFWI